MSVEERLARIEAQLRVMRRLAVVGFALATVFAGVAARQQSRLSEIAGDLKIDGTVTVNKIVARSVDIVDDRGAKWVVLETNKFNKAETQTGNLVFLNPNNSNDKSVIMTLSSDRDSNANITLTHGTLFGLPPNNLLMITNEPQWFEKPPPEGAIYFRREVDGNPVVRTLTLDYLRIHP